MLKVNYNEDISVNDNNDTQSATMLEMLAAQDMFAPEKAIEVMRKGIDFGYDFLAP